MDRADPAGVRVRRPCAIDRCLERGGNRVIGGRIGPRPPCRRHRLRAQLCDDALPDVGVSSRIGDINAFEHKAGGTKSLTVAGDAVLAEHRLDVRPLDSRLGLRGEPLARGRRRRLNAGQRNGHPATDDEREDRGTALHFMCARTYAGELCPICWPGVNGRKATTKSTKASKDTKNTRVFLCGPSCHSWSSWLSPSVHRHTLLQLLEPVEHNHHAGRRRGGIAGCAVLQHEEPLAVGRYVVLAGGKWC